MLSRIPGALVRAVLMGFVVLIPALVLNDPTSDATQIVILVGFFAAALTFFEYLSVYPGLVEFRDAPPFNRIRYIALFLMLTTVSVVFAGPQNQSTFAELVTAIGQLVGQAMDFPYSPVRLVLLMMPEPATPLEIAMVRSAAGLAYLISLVALGVFVIMVKASQWPTRGRSFNVWVNLPTFDPTTGGDVVLRLERDARYNTALGFLLPFLTPPVIHFAGSFLASTVISNQQTLVWMLVAWAFLPASLFMRGIALQRVGMMIVEQRQKNTDLDSAAEMQVA